MKTCKECAYDKMCYLTHVSEQPSCCEFEPSAISELERLKTKIKKYYWLLDNYGNVITQNNVEAIIDNRISELKEGENK